MKIVFINPSLRPGSKRKQLPVGLGCIMTAVEKAGFEFDLIDMDINEISMKELEKVLGQKTYDVYALGCIVTGFRFVRDIANIIKKINPNSVVIAGNSVATSIPEILLNNTKVDIAVMGEGDVTIVELLRALEGKKDISSVDGVVFKKDGKIIATKKRVAMPDIDTFGFPNWDLFDLEQYNKHAKVNVNFFTDEPFLSFPLNSARGCPFSCTFCYHVFRGDRYRRCSEEATIAEMKRLYEKYGCNFTSFWDELTFPSVESLKRRVDNLNKLNMPIKWCAPVRGDLLKNEHLDLVRAVKDTGCDNLSFALENASPEILKAMNKKMNTEQFIEQAKVIQKGGVTPLTSIVFGYPQETKETIKMTLDVCEECGIYPSVGFLLPLPGTPIYEWAKESGYIGDEVKYLERIGDRQDFHINLTQMPDEEFVSTVESELKKLAKKQGLELESVFKTTTYQKPKNVKDFG